jgi:phage N-6-adenine-methyltransferase
MSKVVQSYRTPLWLFNLLNDDFGPFDLDPFASDGWHLCDKYFTEETDGFAQDWGNTRPFVNPPWAKTAQALRLCHRHHLRTEKPVVALINAGISTKWFHTLKPFVTTYLPDLRVNYHLPDRVLKGFNRDSMILHWGGSHELVGEIVLYPIRERRERYEKPTSFEGHPVVAA